MDRARAYFGWGTLFPMVAVPPHTVAEAVVDALSPSSISPARGIDLEQADAYSETASMASMEGFDPWEEFPELAILGRRD